LLAAVTVTIFGMILLVIAMLDDRFAIEVTFDPTRGYVATHASLPQPVIAMSLAAVHARVGRQLGIAAGSLQLKLDRAARLQRDVRRRGGAARADVSRRSPAG
jgi:hypothetical protein